jgi:AraC-like DNA-binding protein
VETVFDTRELAPERRFRAWQEMICDVYVHLDVATDDPSGCEGRVRQTQFGAVKLTETTGFPQRFMRRKSHLAKFDKDCFYMQFIRRGAMQIVQRNTTVMSHPGAGVFISACDPYEAIYRTKAQALYLEIPRADFLSRFPTGRLPAPNTVLKTASGMGRIAAEFCESLVRENAALSDRSREALGAQIMDIVAAALDGCETDGAERSIRRARLHSIKSFIDDNLGNPTLSPAFIAKHCDVSVSYLHHLFKDSGDSVSEWIWLRRLQRCHEMIMQPAYASASITEIAYSMGFSSSSHFSGLFKSRFGFRPSDLRRPVANSEG